MEQSKEQEYRDSFSHDKPRPKKLIFPYYNNNLFE